MLRKHLFLSCLLAAICQWAEVLAFSSRAHTISPAIGERHVPPVSYEAKSLLSEHYVFRRSLKTCLKAKNNDGPENSSGPLVVENDKLFNWKTTVGLVGGQSLLVGIAAIAAVLVGTPNSGLGPGIDFSMSSIQQGAVMTLPLGILAVALDVVENRFDIQALQDVTTATQRSVLALLGGSFKPLVGLVTATALGIAAGLGEEMLFRGVLQYELGTRFGDIVAVFVASVIFGALHAVTPLYAFLASLASVYFGYLYLSSGNLAVPIATHAL